MPYLYCEQHGQAHEADTIENQERYREEGETVLIVSGPLKTGPWLCDSCNNQIARGSTAYLLSPLPGWITESTDKYGLVYERQYFAMKGKERIAVYGAAWPGIGESGGRVRGSRGPARTAKREPICALDLLPTEERAALRERLEKPKPND